MSSFLKTLDKDISCGSVGRAVPSDTRDMRSQWAVIGKIEINFIEKIL